MDGLSAWGLTMGSRVGNRRPCCAVCPDQPRPCGPVFRGWRRQAVSPRREGAAGRAGGMAERPGLRPEKQTEIPFRRRQNAPRRQFSGSLRRVAVFGPYRSASDGQVGRRPDPWNDPGIPQVLHPGRRALRRPPIAVRPPCLHSEIPLHPLPPPLRIADRASLPCDGTGTIMGAASAMMVRDAEFLGRLAKSGGWRRGIC